MLINCWNIYREYINKAFMIVETYTPKTASLATYLRYSKHGLCATDIKPALWMILKLSSILDCYHSVISDATWYLGNLYMLWFILFQWECRCGIGYRVLRTEPFWVQMDHSTSDYSPQDLSDINLTLQRNVYSFTNSFTLYSALSLFYSTCLYKCVSIIPIA